MKRFLHVFALFCVAVGLCFSANAQLAYDISTSTQSYIALAGGTNVNHGAIWGNNSSFTIPMGINFSLNGKTCLDSVYIDGGQKYSFANFSSSTASFGNINQLEDRGSLGATSLSPITYLVSGAPGNRIFKLEVANAGYSNQDLIKGTLTDFVNMQLWLYEGSNIVELHFGPKQNNDSSIYLPGVLLYFKNLTTTQTTYGLFGDPENPIIDSGFSTVDYFPTDGIVYRFSPNKLMVSGLMAPLDANVCPTACNNEVNINWNGIDVAEYKIITMAGIVILHSKVLFSGVNQVDVGMLPQGLYLIEITDHFSKRIFKFTKL